VSAAEARHAAALADAVQRDAALQSAAYQQQLIELREKGEREKEKRGGREEHVSVDADWGRLRFETELTQNLSPELSLDRAWARLLVDQSLQALAANYARGGKADEFAVLSEFLEPGTAARLYADAAAQLGISENNLKVRVHRMRGKFRRILEQRVRETMGPETDELQDEVRHLIRVLE
jgi:hypothetical protein